MGGKQLEKILEVPVFESQTLRLAFHSHDHYTMQYCMKGHAKSVHGSHLSSFSCCHFSIYRLILKFKKALFDTILVFMCVEKCPSAYLLCFVAIAPQFAALYSLKVEHY